MADSGILRGYGQSRALMFSGEAEDFELWAVKFKGFLRINKLLKVLEPPATDTTTVDEEKNAEVFALMIQFLDDKSLNLIIRDAEDKGREAFKILKDHYLGASKPRIISLYTELTSLKIGKDEGVTEYMLRAEKAASRLKQAEETISDQLLIAMVLKGLPESFKAFSTIMSNSDEKMPFSKFKSALRSYEENESARATHSASSSTSDNVYKIRTCYSCGQAGHIKTECPNKVEHKKQDKSKKRWCDICRMSNHDTKFCRKNKGKYGVHTDKNAKLDYDYDDQSFIFKIMVHNKDSIYAFNDSTDYMIDCGATAHILSDPDLFVNFDKNFKAEKHVIELADCSRQVGVVTGRGDAEIMLDDSTGKSCKILLTNALCIPSYKQNILSVHAMTEKGLKVVFTPETNNIIMPNGTVFNMRKVGKLYFIKSIKEEIPRVQSGPEESKQNIKRKHTGTSRSLEEWHYILGHCNTQDILSLEETSIGMKISDKNEFECKACIEGKMFQRINTNADAKASKPLELVHSDLCGPISPESMEGSKYCINFIDDHSGLISVYFLKNKSDAANATKRFLADMAPFGEVKCIRTDNGGEFTSREFKDVLVENRIKHEFSAPYSPHQNGTAERAWRTLFNAARCIMSEGNVPKHLWNYAVRYVAYVRNRCFSRRLGMTPFQKFTGKEPDLSKVQQFGIKCFAYVQNKSKLDSRAVQGQYVGQDPISPAHLVYVKHKNEVQRVRTVTFSKHHIDHDFDCLEDFPMSLASGPSNARDQGCKPKIPIGKHVPIGKHDPIEKRDPIQKIDPIVKFDSVPAMFNQSAVSEGEAELITAEDSILNDPTSTLRYPKRVRNRPKHLEDYDLNSDDEFHDSSNMCLDYFYRVSDVPLTYEEAISSGDSDEWVKAMESEMSSLITMETFELCPKPDKKSHWW